MATWLRIGTHVINLDQVTRIDDLTISMKGWFGPEDSLLVGDDQPGFQCWLLGYWPVPQVASFKGGSDAF